MQFFDQVYIDIESGAWGNGIVAWRREKHVQYGWPSWGDGGKWGDIIFVGDDNERTLMRYRYQTIFKAESWNHGGNQQEYGKHGEDLRMQVPVGTIIKDYHTGAILWSVNAHGEEFIAMKWGQWGVGNMHFTTPTNQYPTMALLGEPNERRKVYLELQLLADVALIGTPSVWKSTLINAISNAKAKTAEYHFTTLVPNLWVIEHKWASFHMIDIPGLIQWAAGGKWLWNEFLRHILKARALCFLVDATQYEAWRDDFHTLMWELNQYVTERFGKSLDFWEQLDVQTEIVYQNNRYIWRVYSKTETWEIKILIQKYLLRVVSKSDAFSWDNEIQEEYIKEFIKYLTWLPYELDARLLKKQIYPLSSFSRNWLVEWLDTVRELVDTVHEQDAQIAPYVPILDQHTPQEIADSCIDVTEQMLPWLIEKWMVDEDQAENSRSHIRQVIHPEISRLTAILPWWNDEAELWFRRILEKEWYLRWLRANGADHGDILKIESIYAWKKEKWVLWE